MSAIQIGTKARGRTIAPEPQRGAALMVLLVVLVTASVFLLLSRISTAQFRQARQAMTTDALTTARDALIGRAVSDGNRPGSLPCPDTDDDGSAELLAGSNCPSYIGRLPWRTLGLTDLRDAAGERLWYALSPSVRDHSSAQPINSRTAGELSLDGVADIAAIIVAPGAPLSTQAGRPGNNVADYLDGSNADGDLNYSAGPVTSTFNDRVMVLSRADLMAAVERRVAAEVGRILRGFFRSSGTIGLRYLPYAATLGTNSPAADLRQGLLPVSCRCVSSAPPSGATYACICDGAADLLADSNFQFIDASGTCAISTPTNCQCSVGLGTCVGNRINGSVAASVRSTVSVDAMQIDASGNLTVTPPDWFRDNQWERLSFVAIAGECSLAAVAPRCSSGTMLSAGHRTELAAVVISTGAPLASTEVSGTPQTGFPSALAGDYLDSIENTNADDVFSAPGKPRGAAYNDFVIGIAAASL